MSRAVKRRDHIDAIFLRLGEDLTNLLLAQILIRHDRRIRLTLDAESEVLGEMHLQRVQLHIRHLADLADEPVFGDVFTRAVYMQTALCYIRVIRDRAIDEIAVADHHGLNGAQAIHDGIFTGCGQHRAILPDLDAICFIAV